MLQPEVVRMNTGSLQCLFPRQTLQVTEESVYLMIQGGILLVSTEEVFPLPPQRIQGIQLRRPLRQPDQLDVIPRSQLHRAIGRVAGVFIQQQSHVPSPVVMMNHAQKRLEVSSLAVVPSQKQAGAGPQVPGPQD